MKNKIKIMAFYRQPSNPTDLNGLLFIDIFENILSKNSNALIFGDFNFNLLNRVDNIFKYENSFALNGFSLLNSLSECFATRKNPTSNSVSIIDHGLTDLNLYHQHITFSLSLFHRFMV
ncbi:hypothetical protein ACKWTF_013109 [Chironomus riparius]